MKNYRSKKSIPVWLLAAAAFLTGCADGSAGPGRKKMPEFVGTGNGYSDTQFFSAPQRGSQVATNSFLHSGPAGISYNATDKESVNLSLPSSADAQVFTLLELYRPFVPALISQWGKQQGKRVVINFCGSSATSQNRSEYLIQSQENPDIPFSVIWDEQSSKRVQAYLSAVTEIPGLTVKSLEGKL